MTRILKVQLEVEVAFLNGDGGSNSYGDAIFWGDIVKHVLARGPEHVCDNQTRLANPRIMNATLEARP